jgi:hypothetical protein
MLNSVAESDVKGDLTVRGAAKSPWFPIGALRHDLRRVALETINLVINRFRGLSNIAATGYDAHKSQTNIQLFVDNWLVDIQRRGAKLYEMKQRNGTLYLSCNGKGRFRYAVQIDFDAQRLHVEFDRPEWRFVKREVFLLNAVNLHLLAKRICPLAEGQAMIPVRLLVQLSIICRAYQSLVQKSNKALPVDNSINQVAQIQSELRRRLTALELQSAYRPLDFRPNLPNRKCVSTEARDQSAAN